MIWRHVQAAVAIWRAVGINLSPIFHAVIDPGQTTILLGPNNMLDEGDGAIYRYRLQNSEEMQRLWDWRENRWHNGGDLAAFFVDIDISKADPDRLQVYVCNDPGFYSFPVPGRALAHELGHILMIDVGRDHEDFRSGLMVPDDSRTEINDHEASIARAWVRRNLTAR
jgi:hypothetical protein